ncbi:unnamed protein product [Rhizophagus irregularis]|uniref:DUF659 domain-containing protein n=1 Tax=Rhizophagus irregularis TaxID=588596 RepID=A0A916EB91_9GLOM|nr:unnamed protein product [Rhizophagus irregularis]
MRPGIAYLSGASIYNYIILTPDREQYLYSLNDYSSDHHTEEFLPSEITNIIGKIGSKKITALVTDNAANCVKAREIVTSQFSNIIDLRYIAHFINLITKQIMGHDMAKQTIKSCNRIISFFKRSHIVGKLLADAATTLQIEGGGQGLKTEYWKIITTTAGQIWRNNGGDKKSCNRLLAQICNYELRRSPYNQDFDNSLETPISWCQQYTNEELYEMINNSTFLQFEEEDDEVDNRIRSITLEIPNHEVRVLIIENYFDLKDTVKGLNNNDKNSDDSDVESDSDSDVGSDVDSENLNDSANNNSENETESDYDVEELVQ